MLTKEEIKRQILENPAYKAAISQVKEDERIRIEGLLDGSFIDTLVALSAFADHVKSDPEAQAELARQLKIDRPIVTNEPMTSSSLG